ncbi:hypothetical protein KUH32_16725 [Thalassococcus sp. CAU 1522]|uniref:Uncharacterized protein n=1 Tax=Thalassococcus arenae TaxID=2851652 RepID=A0ABS6NBK9_9RHOB|nr:hypothetical protein [Thalassococcus arenae]MBV2361411.1 hypothetical protein [Thalassococcus arenae]
MTIARDHLLYLGAVSIAVIGYLLDRRIGADAFARSGAVIVAFGAAMAGREIYAMERAITRHEARVEKLEAAYLDAAQSGEGEAREDAFSRLAKNLADYRAARIERVGRMIRAEIVILCFGTIVWGFGDLVV